LTNKEAATSIDAVPESKKDAAGARPGQKFYIQGLGIGFFYILVVAFFSIESRSFFTYSNALNILDNVVVLGLVSIGQCIAIVSGGFDLSVSGVLPVGAVLFTILTNAGMNTGLAILCVVAVGAAVGVCNGLIIAKLKINPLITTLGTLSIGTGLAYSITNGVTIALENPDAGFLSDFVLPNVPYFLPVFIAIVIVSDLVLRYSIFGRVLYSVGGNREASKLAGIRVDLATVSVYAVSAALAAFAGVVASSQLLAGSATVGSSAALSSVAAVILGGASLAGGIGGIRGTLVGVLLLGTITNGMALIQVPTFYQQIATGVILLLGVGFARLREILAQSE
jgi:ribose transport system permease protein